MKKLQIIIVMMIILTVSYGCSSQDSVSDNKVQNQFDVEETGNSNNIISQEIASTETLDKALEELELVE